MKTTKLSVEAAKEELSKQPTRQKGQWILVIEEVKKSGSAVKVSDLTRGSCWGLMRAVKEAGLVGRVVDKSTGVIILPPEKSQKVK